MSDPALNDVLAKIEDHASTIDPWETNSYRGTIVGLGTMTGKAIMNVGIGILRSVDYVAIQSTLRRISRRQRRRVANDRSALDDLAYQSILEYQRYAIEQVSFEFRQFFSFELST